MELRQLQHFIAVAEERHFTRAAQRVNIVQSALSSSIRALEEELNSRLVMRNTRNVQLTPAGQALLERAREALRILDAGRDEVADIENLRSGTLSIGSVHTLPSFLDLPSLIARFHAANPGIEVRLRQSDTTTLIEHLRTGQLDLAFLPLLDAPDDIATGIVACEDLSVITPPNHPLAGRVDLALSDLADFPFVDFEIGWGTRPLVDRSFAVANIQRRTIFDLTDLETVVDLVARGLGIALMPETIAEARCPRIATAELAGPAICWELVVAHLRSEKNESSPVNGAAKSFLKLLTFF